MTKTKRMLFIAKLGLLALALVALPLSFGFTHGKFFSTSTASADPNVDEPDGQNNDGAH